jgi:hypothetical protein
MASGSRIHPGFLCFQFVVLTLLYADLAASQWTPDRLLQLTQDSCKGGDSSAESILPAFEKSDIQFRGRQVGTKYRLTYRQDAIVELDVLHPAGRPSRFVAKLFDLDDNPQVLISMRPDCTVQLGRRVNYNDQGKILSIGSLDEDLAVRGEPDWVNPPLDPPQQRTKAGSAPVRVGMVDSGVNYTLPVIRSRLARDDNNRLVGYDFWDEDGLPYDAQLINSGFFVQRHGTRTASVLLREAPDIELVPYRYPRPDMSRMKALIEHADMNEVSIIGMPLGSDEKAEWSSFERAAEAHPHILFIVSAGNNGRDIDRAPVYPASLDIDNMLVVTSAGDFVRPAERTNWGNISVDYLVPAEKVDAIDYSGDNIKVSGSSYAVSRVAALAARIKSTHRDWNAKQIIAEMRARFGVTHVGSSDDRVLDWVSSGYIADPLAGAAIKKTLRPSFDNQQADNDTGLTLSLDILRLDTGWSRERIQQIVQQASGILSQCGLSLRDLSLNDVEGSDYLKDLSVGSARTLLGEVERSNPVIVFARDTRMQTEYMGEAFGIGNTRSRSWLRNSVWLMLGVDDPGIALAHELFHVLANDGDHVDLPGNLMQVDTHPENVQLTSDQCELLYRNGRDNGLLRE